MTDKLIRASLKAWQTLKAAAFNRNTYIKTVLDDIISEKLADKTE